ncbi:hypothetical protein EVAR_52168_1 [Eumeta japonica]|uniref:Uncharacterized protein n=1 Tax=Eumeta variegata TaxID=151549 RepID=A0A4C1Y8V3_EUMVA|nr:hypothetical protein EVAR_52168_1 [Eumeta japonica]
MMDPRYAAAACKCESPARRRSSVLNSAVRVSTPPRLGTRYRIEIRRPGAIELRRSPPPLMIVPFPRPPTHPRTSRNPQMPSVIQKPPSIIHIGIRFMRPRLIVREQAPGGLEGGRGRRVGVKVARGAFINYPVSEAIK